jgi:branched-chain amino acid transport system ATP-binding protein
VNEGLLAVYKLFPILEKNASKKAGLLSGNAADVIDWPFDHGKPQTVAVGRTSLGLAPLVIVEIFNVINRINREKGTTVFLVEQNAMMALKLASWLCHKPAQSCSWDSQVYYWQMKW